MLKLNYTDYGLFLEQITASLDAVATQRIMLAVYAGEPLHLEPGRAAFLLQADIPGVAQLKRVLQSDATEAITLTIVDDEFVEVSLKGTWIASTANAEAGTFITALAPDSEILIYQLWQATQRQTAYSV
ncbi:MAG: alr0857 family protein [Cyanobacteria bacterium J06635_15]